MTAIEKRGESSYRLTVSCGYDKLGKQVRKARTIDLSHISPKKQHAEAEKQFIFFQEEIKKGLYVNNEKMTFEEFIEKWLTDYANVNLQPKTLLEYKSLLVRVIPALGHLKLIHIQPTHLIAFYNNLRVDGIRSDGKEGILSENTILHYHRLISSILTSALQWGFIINNPAQRVKAPKIAKKEARHYTIEEVAYIIELLEDEPLKYKTMITLAIYGGMRRGELNALTWDDIQFDNFLINIDKSLQHLPGEDAIVKSTKTENTRVISIPSSAMDLLKEYKKWQNAEKLQQGNGWIETDCLFTGVKGGHIFPNTISKWFLKFIRRHNEYIMSDDTIRNEHKKLYLIREVNFHGLRHTSATILISQNVDVSTVSKRLGHAKTSTTMDIYSHSLQKSDTAAANKLENLFTKNKHTKKQDK